MNVLRKKAHRAENLKEYKVIFMIEKKVSVQESWCAVEGCEQG